MITPQFPLLAATVVVAACVQGTLGIGFALIVAPVLAFLRPELLPVSLLFLMLPLNLFTALRERQALDWSGGSWITLGRAFGAIAGALGVLAVTGRTTSQQIVSAALLLPFLATGGMVSSFIRNRVNGPRLRGLVLAFALTSGIVLLVRG